MIELRELADPEFHQWRSLCRHLMETDPVGGAADLEATLGRWTRFHPGWNRFPSDPCKVDPFIYVYISDDGGCTTTERPDVPPDQIQDGPAPPEFGQMLAAQSLRALAARLGARYPGSRTVLNNEVERIVERSHVPCEWLDRSAFRHRLADAFRCAGESVSEARMGKADVSRAEAPILKLVQDYLDCKLAGRDAAATLSEVIFLWCRLPLIWPVSVRFHDLHAQLNHLLEICHKLKTIAAGLDVPSYLDALRLALLYAWSGMLAARKAAGALANRPDDQQVLLRTAFNLDEMQAHYFAGANRLTALFTPKQSIEWLLGRSAPEEAFDSNLLYPPLKPMLDRDYVVAASEAEVWQEYCRISAMGNPVHLASLISDGEWPFLAPSIRKGVQERLAGAAGPGETPNATALSESDQIDAYLADIEQILSRSPEQAWPDPIR